MSRFPIIIAVAVAVGSVAFYGGMKYAESKNPRGQSARGGFQNLSPEERQARLRQFGAAIGAGAGPSMRSDGGFSAGEIISKDDKSITLKLRDGGSKIIFFSSATAVSKSVLGSAEDLKIGEEVTISGEANPEGSVTAKSIQIRPIGQSN